MTLVSEFIAALQKINQVAGDVPIVVKHVEQDAETELLSLGLHVSPQGDSAGKVVLEHGTPQAPAPAPAPEPVAATA